VRHEEPSGRLVGEKAFEAPTGNGALTSTSLLGNPSDYSAEIPSYSRKLPPARAPHARKTKTTKVDPKAAFLAESAGFDLNFRISHGLFSGFPVSAY
jgi:hypothetical protein